MKACTTKIAVLACYTAGLYPISWFAMASDLPLTVGKAVGIVTSKGFDVMLDSEGGCCEQTFDDEIAITVWPTVDLEVPWTGTRKAVSMRELDSKWDALVPLMDDEVREAIHDQGIEDKDTFWAEYVSRVGPLAAGVLWYS